MAADVQAQILHAVVRGEGPLTPSPQIRNFKASEKGSEDVRGKRLPFRTPLNFESVVVAPGLNLGGVKTGI